MLVSAGITVLCSIVLQSTEAAPATTIVPEAAQHVLQKNAEDLDGLELTIAIERRLLADTSTLPAELQPLSSKGVLAPEVNVVRINGPRFYEKSTQGLYGTAIGERTYDGRALYSGRPPGRNEESLLTIDSVNRCLANGKRSGFPNKHFHWNYFEDAGYHLPELPHEIGESSSSLVLHLAKLGRVVSWVENSTTGMQEVALESPDPWSQVRMTPQQIKDAVSHLLGESRQYQEAILQRLVKRSESEPFRLYRFSLDPALGLAVREKRETTSKGALLSHAVCEDFAKVQDRDAWLPKKCRVLVYASESFPSYISRTPLYEITLILKAVEHKTFSDKDFALWYDSPGGSVFDYTAEDATANIPVTYQVPGDASQLAKASKDAVFGENRTRWLIIINVVAIVALVAIYGIRQGRVANDK